MKILYLDAVGGAAGDMILAAFIDGLVPPEYLQEQIALLQLPDYEIRISQTMRHKISAKRWEVLTHDHTHRHLSDVEELIQASALSDFVKQNSIEVFRLLAQQEGKVHNQPVEKVHFHEVGAVDSLIDIVGTFVCVEYLKPDVIFTSPLPISHGIIEAAHGKLPVPAPATLELLKDFPVIYRDVEGELVTPTGAVLFTYLSRGELPQGMPFRIRRIGYGAGSRDFPQVPNLLRIWEGEMDSPRIIETVYQVETNIDDMNPEIFPYVQEKLLTAGALDVSLYTGIMKKGRPGTLISVLVPAERLNSVKAILYRETTTIGLRYFPVHREKLPREEQIVETPWGKMRIKKVELEGEELWLPEYEECRRIARESGKPLLRVYREVEQFLRQHSSGKSGTE